MIFTLIFLISQLILVPHGIIFMGAAGWYKSQANLLRLALLQYGEEPSKLALVVELVEDATKWYRPWFVKYWDWLMAL